MLSCVDRDANELKKQAVQIFREQCSVPDRQGDPYRVMAEPY